MSFVTESLRKRSSWKLPVLIFGTLAIVASLGMSSYSHSMGPSSQIATPRQLQPPTPPPFATVHKISEASKSLAKASWYGRVLHGHRTASGERFDMFHLTAAHTDLPFGTLVKVKNLRNGRAVVVRINDRGEFGEGQIDLSYEAARQLQMIKSGVAMVELEVIGSAPKRTLPSTTAPRTLEAKARLK